MEQVDVEDGLGQVYDEQSDTFHILNQGQDAFRFQYSYYNLGKTLKYKFIFKFKLNAFIYREMFPLCYSHPPPVTSQCPCW